MSMNPDEIFSFIISRILSLGFQGGKGVHQNLSLGFQGGKGVHQNLVDAEVQKTMCIRTDKICLPFIKHPLLKFKELSERRCAVFYYKPAQLLTHKFTQHALPRLPRSHGGWPGRVPVVNLIRVTTGQSLPESKLTISNEPPLRPS